MNISLVPLHLNRKMENNRKILPHLTKEQRLPRCFKEVEKVVRSVKSCQQNYKTILANSRLRGHIHKKVYSMTVNVLKYYSYIQKIIDKIQLLEKEKYLRREIALVLIYELIFGSGFLPGESKVVKTIRLYENEIFRIHEVLQNGVEGSLVVDSNIPRYVRVHTLVTTVPYVIKDLISYGFHQVVYEDELSEEKYLELVKNLNKGYFLIDFHFKDVLVFEHQENLVSLDLYKKGHIFLQDKSSYIPVHVLNPQPGCAVLDACAAPGMKTIHIGAKMKNKGILIACERDKSRFKCLKEMLDCGSVKICKTFCKDFKLIDPSDQAYSTIEYILLDPSCSGSGMVNRMDEVTDSENSKNSERLMKLAGFQIILLKHSLKFPAVKRVVYSTCSIHEEENEYVVHEALKAFNGMFKLIPVMPEWSYRGSEKFEFGKLCLRTDPKVHLTNGFFVAVFERINYSNNGGESLQNYQACDDYSFNKRMKKSKPEKSCNEKTIKDCAEINVKLECKISQSLKSDQVGDSRHITLLNENDESFAQNADNEVEQNLVYTSHTKKKQKKKKREKLNECSSEFNLETSDESALKCSKLKKYSHIQSPENDNITISHMRNDKSEHNEHNNKRNSYENIEVMDEFAGVTKLHKNKKKKKEKEKFFETEMLHSDLTQNTQNMLCEQKCSTSKLKGNYNNLLSESQSDSGITFTMKDISTQNECLRDMSCEDPENFIPTTSHKKKKKRKKEHLNVGNIQPCSKFTEDYISRSLAVSDNSHRHHQLRNISENNEIPEELTDLTLLQKKNKKKKKKEKISIEKDV